MDLIIDRIYLDFDLSRPVVSSVMTLLGNKHAVPFIARYSKTKLLDFINETDIRAIEHRVGYYRELLERRDMIVIALLKQNGNFRHRLKSYRVTQDVGHSLRRKRGSSL